MKRSRLLPALLTICILTVAGCGTTVADEEKSPETLADLKGKKVACIAGSVFEVTALPNVGGVDILPLSSPAELYAALRTGKCDYVVEDLSATYGINLDEMGCRTIFECKEVSGEYGFGMSYPADELSKQLNEFIALIKENGMMDEMAERWTGKDMLKAKMPLIEMPTEGKTLEVAIYNVNFPFGFIQNGKIAGLDAEILARFGQHIGRPVHFTGYDFASLTAVLASNKAEIIAGTITITEERREKILFSDSYFPCVTICIEKSNNVTESKSPKEFVKDGISSSLITERRWRLLLDGLWETIIISLFSIILGTLLGALICWMRMSKLKVMNGIAYAYVEFMRGLPMLVFLMMMFYIVFAATAFTATIIAIVAFSMNFGAFTSEIFRTGISSIDKGQTEAGLAVGFTRIQTFIFIVLPQAVKNIIPVFKNEAISLVKNTSIVGYIAIQDLTKVSDIIRSRTFDAFFPLILISIAYLILAWLLGKTLDLLNRRLS